VKTLRPITGVSAVVGGLSWTSAALVHNSLPQGCVGDACTLGGPMRGASALGVGLLVLAGAFLAISLAGLLLLARREAGVGRAGVSGGVACLVGLILLGTAGVTSSFIDSNWEHMPLLVAPGVLFLSIGLALVAWSVWRARVLPGSFAATVLVTLLLLPVANEQTSLVLLAIPFGLAWTLVGAWMLGTVRQAVPQVGVSARGLP